MQAYGAEDDRVFGIPGEVSQHVISVLQIDLDSFHTIVLPFRIFLVFTPLGHLLVGTMAFPHTDM